MKYDIYDCDMPSDVAEIVEDMRKIAAKSFGITHAGNRITLRWYKKDKLVSMHMVILEVDNGEEEPEEAYEDK